MSDTPRTDKAEASALEVGQWHLAKLCRELERENAALREKLEDPARLHAHCVRYLTDAQVSHLFGERMTAIQNDRNRLEAENAALRERIEMLSKPNTKQTDEYVCVDREHGLWKRKETQQ